MRIRSRPWTAVAILAGGTAAIFLGMMLSVSFGARDVPFHSVWSAIFQYNSLLTEHQIINEVRLPRVIGGLLVGSSLAVAGAIMQGMTRNPLADSGLMGLHAGSGFVITISFAFFPDLSFLYIVFYSFLGAALGAALVYGIGSIGAGGLTPVRLVLAGAALGALFSALGDAIAIYFRIGQDIAFWHAGGVAGTKWFQLRLLLPVVGVALLGAIALSRSITMLSLGEETAKGLGQRTKLVKLAATLVVLVLAGSAVAIVGAIGFVGLLIPHLTRKLVGVDYRLIIPCSAVLGGLLVVFADQAARMIRPPYETPVASLIAILGVPFFLYLARKERREL